MKILTGKFKRRNIIVPKDHAKVRMTTGIVKEAVINIFKDFIEDSTILDVFAGSGNVGIEFLSNNAGKVVFIDSSHKNINIIKTNLEKLEINKNQYELITNDFQIGIKRAAAHNKFDFIYLDPPYHTNMLLQALMLISTLDILSEDSVIIAEHHIKERLDNNIGSLEKFDHRRYGTVILDFYRKKLDL